MSDLKKELRKILRAAEKQGCAISITRNNHVKIDTRNGIVFCAKTPSDRRGLLNLRAILRQKGLDL